MLNSIYLKIFQDYFRFKTVFLLFLIFVPAILTAQKAINNPQAQQLLDKSNKSRFFIENKGQWPKQVKFLARLGGMNCWITDSGVVYDYYQITGNFKQEETLNLLPHEKDEFERTHTSCKGQVVRLDYAGINLNAEKQGIDKKEAYYNYFIGNDSTKWASFVGLYGEVLVKDAYKGIDIRYYFDNGQIRYDYLVKPEADISQINLRLTGANEVAVNESGEMIIQTSLGVVKHGKLYAYQQTGNEKKEVNCRFEMKEDGNYGVIASNYEKGLALVIDPLVWSTFIGGGKSERGYTIAVDSFGYVYIAGTSASINYPTTIGAYDTSYSGGTSGGMDDIAISKLNSNASSLIYSTYLGGNNTDFPGQIKLDHSNNLVLAGFTASPTFPTTSGAYDQSFNGLSDDFITKLSNNGSALIFSTFLGGLGGESMEPKLLFDSNDHIYITGLTSSTDFPVTSGVYDALYNNGGDVFVTKLNSSGNTIMNSTFIGGSVRDESCGIVRDDSGFIYITGNTNSNNFPVSINAYDQSFNGDQDIFISKLNSDLSSLEYSTYLGGAGQEGGRSIVLDDSGYIYIAGETTSNNFPTTLGTYDSLINGVNDFIITKFNNNLSNLIFSTYFGGNQDESFSALCLDHTDGIILTGLTTSTDFPTTPGAFDNSHSVYLDAIISRFSNDDYSLTYSTYIGGNSTDYCDDIVVDNYNDVYIIGGTASADFPTTIGVYSRKIMGGFDIFITKFDLLKQANNIVFPNIGCSQMHIKWNKGDGNKRVVFIREANKGVPLPVNKTTYIADTVFGSGSQIGTSGWYCIYNDTGTTVSINGLGSNRSYRIMVLEYTGVSGSEIYNKEIAYGNPNNQLTVSYLGVSFSVNDSSQCFAGNSFNFTNSSSGAKSFLWSFGNGFTDTVSNPTYSYTSTGIFNVKLKAENSVGCIDSVMKKVEIYPMPKAGFSINTKTQNLAGNNFIFTSTSVIPSGNLKYYWDFGDGDTSTASNPKHSYLLAGSYKVVMIATSDFGCADTFIDSVFVLVKPGIIPSFTTKNACVGDTIFFKNTSTIVPPDSFLNFFWGFGDGNQTIVRDDPKHIYYSAGTYYITLRVLTAYGFKDTLTDTIEIYPSPMVDITAVPDTISIPGRPVTLTASGLYDQLLWSDNSTGSSITVNLEGKYWVTAAYNNGCKSSDTIELTKGDNKEIDVMNVITPNGDGFNDKLVIKNIDRIQPCKFAIYNRWGDELYSSDNYQNNWEGTYNGKALPEGTYYFVLEAKDGKVYKGAVNILK